MARHLLTDVAARKAGPRDKPYRLHDGDGLALWISPTGAKSWQLRYRYRGREQTASLGKYPRLGLAEAREKAEERRKLIENGVHATAAKHIERLRERSQPIATFRGFASHWVQHEARRARWSPAWRAETERSIDQHLKRLHRLQLADITAPIAVSVLREIERDKPVLAEKVRRRLRGILDFAVEEGMIPGNPLPARRRGPKLEKHHYPAITDRTELGAMLRSARASDPSKGVARVHLLLTYTAQRIGAVSGAQWSEFDLQAGVWSIPRERMKIRDKDRGPHLVPIPPRLLAEIKSWREADPPDTILVCPTPRNAKKIITREAVEKFYRDVLGVAGKHSPHSWRSVLKSWSADAGKDRDAVEAQLDHRIGGKTESAYDRSKRLEIRRDLMAWHEATLLAARDGAVVVSLTGSRR